MREISLLVVHSAATYAWHDIGVEEITRWHTEDPPDGNGWSRIGYHYVIRRNGVIEKGRPETMVGAHARGSNAHSIGICLVGGIDNAGDAEDNFTEQQMTSLEELLHELLARYPFAEVCGHRDTSGASTECPSFDVIDWWADKAAA